MHHRFKPTQTVTAQTITSQTVILILSLLFIVLIPTSSVQANPLNAILNFFKRNPTTLPGRRPGNSLVECSLIPNFKDSKAIKIWNRQPSFFQLKETGSVTLKDPDTDTIVIKKSIVNVQKFSIDLRSIKPGEYRLLLTTDIAVQSSFTLIEIMNETEYQKVKQALDQLDIKDLDPESIALKRSEYFVDQDLIVDALETLFKLDNPSATIITHQDKLIERLCPSGTSRSTLQSLTPQI
jgi:hypothetical protein